MSACVISGSLKCFNPTIVRLKPELRFYAIDRGKSFNPTIVRLKLNLFKCFLISSKFQSYHSSIKTLRNLIMAIVGIRFNPTIVRLKLCADTIIPAGEVVSILP